jgi:hypothetical protein
MKIINIVITLIPDPLTKLNPSRKAGRAIIFEELTDPRMMAQQAGVVLSHCPIHADR